MKSLAKTPKEYLESLPRDRASVISEMRRFILQHLPKGYVEVMEYGMLSYCIPLEKFPDTYNKKPLCVIALAAHKNYNSLYLNTVYMSPPLLTLLENGFRANNKKLEMGQSCINFHRSVDLHLPTLAEIIAAVPPSEFISLYKKSRT